MDAQLNVHGSFYSATAGDPRSTPNSYGINGRINLKAGPLNMPIYFDIKNQSYAYGNPFKQTRSKP